MEQIINFLEQYWGQALIGTTTLGTVITFIVTQIQAGVRDKLKNKKVDDVVSKADTLCTELVAQDECRKSELSDLKALVQTQQKEIAEKEEYFEKVLAATFQAISYLVIASKLPTEDKIALQEKFTSILNTKASEYKETLKDELQALKDETEAKIIPDMTETITNTVSEAKSLLDKYMKEG